MLNSSERSVRFHHLRSAAAFAVLTLCAGTASAQTSGTWIPTAVSGIDWNTPTQWIGAVPNGGGVATFPENDAAFPSVGPTLSTNIALAQIIFNSVNPYTIGGSGSFVLPAGGGSINVVRSRSNQPVPPLNASFGQYNFDQGSDISASITGGPLTVSGTGNVGLDSAGNTYAGGTTISGATLSVINDAQLGDATGSVTLTAGGTLASPAASFSSARSIAISGSGALQMAGAATFGGVVSGSGTLTQSRYSTAGLTFTNANTFSGTLDQASATAGVSTNGIVINGNGSFANVTSIKVGGFLRVENSATVNNNNRLADAATMDLAGGSFRFSNVLSTGNVSTSTLETIGTLTTSSGYSFVSLANVVAGANPGTQLGLKVTNVTRANGALLVVRGNLLSDATPTTGSGIATFISVNAPAGLVGGSGAAGTADLKIVPWMLGGVSSGANSSAVSFMTWNAANGAMRPLASSEYANAFGVATNNVQFLPAASPVAVPGAGATVNSLTLNGAVTVDGSGPITVTSGGVQIKTASGSVINAPIAFPSGVEGVFVAPSDFSTANVISGNAGVSKGFAGTWTVTGSGLNSTYGGPTNITGGAISISGDLPLNSNSALGNSAAPISLNPGEQANARLVFTSSSVVARPIAANGNDPVVYASQLIGSTGTEVVAFNGAFTLNRPITIVFGNPALVAGAPAANVTINGAIGGSGSLINGVAPFVAPNAVFLNAASSFTGGVIDQYGQVYLGNDAALGAGAYTALIRGGPFDVNAFPTLGATAGPAGTNTLRTIANKLLLNSNGLTFNNAIPLRVSGTVDLNGNDTTLVALGAPTEISGSVQAGSLTIVGGSVVTLSGANTFRSGRSAFSSTIPPVAAYGLTIGGVTSLPEGSTAAPGRVVFASPGALPTFIPLTLGSGATATAAAHGIAPKNTLFTAGFTLSGGTDAWDAKLDLKDNDLVVRGGDVATIKNQIKQAAAGNWTGSGGITSSSAGATPGRALGYLLNDLGSGSPRYTTFDGQAVGLTDVLVRYTFLGDANLSGIVEFSDLLSLAQNFDSSGTGKVWSQGDFNYDSVVNFADLLLLAQNFGAGPAVIGGSLTPEFAAEFALAQSLVPEPTSLAVLSAVVAAGVRRRRVVRA